MASAWPARETGSCSQGSHLFGQNGELVELRMGVEPRLLEDFLEALASLDFSVNPQLYHAPGIVRVEFPAYAGHIDEVRRALREAGFDENSIEVFGMLDYKAEIA